MWSVLLEHQNLPIHNAQVWNLLYLCEQDIYIYRLWWHGRLIVLAYVLQLSGFLCIWCVLIWNWPPLEIWSRSATGLKPVHLLFWFLSVLSAIAAWCWFCSTFSSAVVPSFYYESAVVLSFQHKIKRLRLQMYVHEWFVTVVLSAVISVFHRLRLHMYVHEWWVVSVISRRTIRVCDKEQHEHIWFGNISVILH